MRTYYKVVRNCGPAVIPAPQRYRLGKATRSPDGWGPMCVFGTLENARDFARCRLNIVEIYECTIEPSQESSVYTLVGHCVPLYGLPTGTFLADAVTLTKQVGL